ncbi:hypothetical protein NP493_285g02039 [Ridgeia piscesae]|uniref:Uncharacterized protein n=1 Tax=Ridgeia piscesae TaxID=27915 RepID=A0AAD9NX32_RIDPI|nr:hypothetical protein NP493_285g02039 [Ridgeia piscesae]
MTAGFEALHESSLARPHDAVSFRRDLAATHASNTLARHVREMAPKDVMGLGRPQELLEMAHGQVCTATSFLVPAAKSGYLSSHIALDTGRGSTDCPWLIRTDPGRRVVINLIDFGYGMTERTNAPSSEYDLCTVYAIIRERDNHNGVTVCAGTVRNKTVYTSLEPECVRERTAENGPAEEIGNSGMWSREIVKTAVKGEIFGCADPVAPDNTWLKRRDDTAFIGCQASGETWQLRCTGSVWEGHVGNCTRGGKLPAISIKWSIADRHL